MQRGADNGPKSHCQFSHDEDQRRRTYPIRLASHMKRSSLELVEILKEDGDKCCDVLCSFFRRTLHKIKINSPTENGMKKGRETYDAFPVFGVRESYSNGLVDEENIGIGIPRFRVEFRSVPIDNTAWSWMSISTRPIFFSKLFPT